MTRTLSFVLLLVAAGCGGNDDPPVTTAAEPAPSVLTGVIVDIGGAGNDVDSFVLDAGAREYEIRIAPEVDYGFDLSHLEVHREDGLPVRCVLETRDGELYALRIDDA